MAIGIYINPADLGSRRGRGVDQQLVQDGPARRVSDR